MKFSLAVSAVVALLAMSAEAAPRRRSPRITITKVRMTTKTSTRYVDFTSFPKPTAVAPPPAVTTSSSSSPTSSSSSSSSSSSVIEVPTPTPTPTTFLTSTSSSAVVPPPAPTTSSTTSTPPPVVEPTTTSTPPVVTPTTTSTPPVVTPTTTAAPVVTPSTGDDLQSVLLNVHNRQRAIHSAPALQWDSALASQASAHSAKCVFEHSGQGPENLVYASQKKGETTAQLYERMMMLWYDEEPLYNYAAANYVSGAGHFTQMVWKSATKIGCGIAQCGQNMPNYVTCRYDKGNMIGSFAANVLPPQ